MAKLKQALNGYVRYDQFEAAVYGKASADQLGDLETRLQAWQTQFMTVTAVLNEVIKLH